MNYFRIHFVRKNCGSPSRAWRDDILTIFPRNTNGQHALEYLDKDSRMKYTCSLFEENLYSYVNTILLNLIEDTDPFESIQILCPCLPTVLLSVESVKRAEVREQIHENMRVYLRIQGTLRSAEYVPPHLRTRGRTRGRRSADADDTQSESSSDSSSNSSAEEEAEDEEEEDTNAAADDVDEDGFQRLPRELDEEPTANREDAAPTAEGAAEPAGVPAPAEPTPPHVPDGAAAPLGNTPVLPMGPNGTFPYQTIPMYWTVWMPYR